LEYVFDFIEPDAFVHPLTRELVQLILSYYVNQRSFSFDELVMEDLSPEIRDLVTLLAVERESISDFWTRSDPDIIPPNSWKIARDCIIRIEQDSLRRENLKLNDLLPKGSLFVHEMSPEQQAALDRLQSLWVRGKKLASLISG
jgi:hypothetical protein